MQSFKSDEGFVATNCRKQPDHEHENIVYSSHKPRKSLSFVQEKNRKSLQENGTKKSGLNMNKLRYEVIKFGTSGLNPTDKEASSVALAVALGAKPPKRVAKNYKEILSEKKKEKEKSEQLDKRLAPGKPSSRHFYVMGKKVVPAKLEKKDGVKKFLDSYGKVDKRKIGKGFSGDKKKFYLASNKK